VSDEALAAGFISEIEKLAFDPLEALQAAAIGATGAWGAANPKLFEPKWVNPKWTGTNPKGRLASGILGAATAAGAFSVPGLLMAPFRDKGEDQDLRRLTHTAGAVDRLSSARGGRTATKSPHTRKKFKSRSEARKAWRENMKP
tara:strand:- start:66 stop:497 length:432 start_codon:yes stop_codon:yes gene_type:complete